VSEARSEGGALRGKGVVGKGLDPSNSPGPVNAQMAKCLIEARLEAQV
jgi:hypothetical protein